jgi:hypothetical protein
MLNKKNFVVLISLILLALLSGLIGYKLNDFTTCNNQQLPIAKIDDSSQVQRLQQQIIDIKKENKSNTESLTKVIAELTKEASDCRYVKVYHNSLYGFKISLPSEEWCSPSPLEKNPHLYDENGCGQDSRQSCHGIEIQDHSEYNEAGINETFNNAKKENRNPVILKKLIADATVIKSTAPGPAKGWEYEYDIFFNNQRRFLIFSNIESFESVIKTLVLDK